MKKATLSMLLYLALALSVFDGVTEIKIYSNDNPPRFYGDNPVGPNAAANYLGQSKSRPHTNGIVARIGMNNDIMTSVTPPDSAQMWATKEAAAVGTYVIKIHMVGKPNPRLWIDIQRDDTPGYTNYLDASGTERITFWIKGPKGCQYPLWLRTRSKNSPVDGKDVYGAYICIQGETIVRMDAFGYPYAASLTPWNGEWQFVSIPWAFIKTTNPADLQAVVPYSWGGHVEGGHYYGEWLDLSNMRWLALDSGDGGGADKGNYTWPAGGSIGVADYCVDEIVFTLNEGSGVTDVEGNANIMPLAYELGNAYPNPFNPTTTISYSLPVSNHVTVEVFNALGERVRSLVNQFKSAGTYQVSWDGRNDHGVTMPSGVYFCKMQASHFSNVKKMLLAK